jgi:hypothetical protein
MFDQCPQLGFFVSQELLKLCAFRFVCFLGQEPAIMLDIELSNEFVHRSPSAPHGVAL